jgi:hypothetical protein
MFRDLGTETVDLYAGEERRHFVVHKKLLTSQSDYFNKALNGGFKETRENSIHLVEDNPASVGLLVGYLYSGVVPGIVKQIEPFMDSISPTPATPKSEDIAVSTNGSLYPFSVTINPAPIPWEGPQAFPHISFQPEYLLFSPEEIRVADYEANRKGTQTIFASVPGEYPGGNMLPGNLAPAPATAASSASTRSPHDPSFGSLLAPLSKDIPTTTLQQSKMAKWGTSPLISYPESAGMFIEGIPKSKPPEVNAPTTDAHQLALLHLCLLAEKILWPTLFHAALERYAEFAAYRPIPVEHVDLIYGRSSADSGLRVYAVEAIFSTKQGYSSIYMPLAKKYDDFLADILNRL